MKVGVLEEKVLVPNNTGEKGQDRLTGIRRGGEPNFAFFNLSSGQAVLSETCTPALVD